MREGERGTCSPSSKTADQAPLSMAPGHLNPPHNCHWPLMEDGGEVSFAVFLDLKPDIAQQQHTSEAKRTQ